MNRKCVNCNEYTKTCHKGETPVCELRLPIIWQLLDPHKIDGLQRCLKNLGMQIVPIGNDDFKITMV